MTLEEIEIFLAILEKKNLSKAASALYMSQSTLSHRLSALEKELNVTLFERKKGQRTMELTAHGQEFIDIAERWMVLWKESQQLHQIQEHQVLSIGAVASLHQYLFPPMLRKLLASTDPKVSLAIKSTQSSALYPALESHEIDVGFSVLPSLYSSINNEAVLKEEEILVRYCKEPCESGVFGETVHPKQLNPDDELLFHFHPDYTHWHNYWYGFFSRPRMGIGDAYLLEQFLDQPESWTIVPVSMALTMQKRHNVTLHRLTNPPPERICYMLTHRIPRPGKERSMELLKACLDEFLSEGEKKGHLTRMLL